ncbi:MAG: preprotein translocase subunit SecG [Planctomycetota bacterium]|jgi:preprotein translocase subunit SecG
MTVFPFLAVSLVMNVIGILFAVCAVALILVVLIQKGRGGGLSSAFGGGMAGGLLGSKTGDFLTWVTIVLVGVFLMLAVVMAKFYKPKYTDVGGAPATTPMVQPEQQPTAPESSQARPAEEQLPVVEPLIETGDAQKGTDTNSINTR